MPTEPAWPVVFKKIMKRYKESLHNSLQKLDPQKSRGQCFPAHLLCPPHPAVEIPRHQVDCMSTHPLRQSALEVQNPA